jgi:hypothetical protein
MKRLSVLLIIIALLLSGVAVQAAITPIDFVGFAGAGFSSTPGSGQLDSDIWRIKGMSDGDGTYGGTHTAGDFTRGSSSGGVNTGGVYAFDVGGGDRILGVQPGETDFTPGTFTLRIQNTTGATLADIYVAYEIWTRNDQPRANSLHFSYSTDDTTYTSVSALDYATPAAADSSPTWVLTNRSATITGVNLPNNAYIYLQWTGNDVSGSDNRDEYGIDDIEVRIASPNALTLTSLTARAERGAAAALPLLALIAVGVVFTLRRARND